LDLVVGVGVALISGADHCVERVEDERRLSSPTRPDCVLLSTVPVCVVNDSPCNAANPDLRVIHQIPNRILHIVPICNLSTVGTTSNQILQDDPFHKVHVFRVVNNFIEFLPVPNYSSIIPSSKPDFSLFVEAISVESVAV